MESQTPAAAEPQPVKPAGGAGTQATWHGIVRAEIPWFPTVDTDACIHCGLCYLTCGRMVYEMPDDNQVAVVADPYKCMVGCSTCGTICPAGAISFPDPAIVQKTEREHKILKVVREEVKAKKTKVEMEQARAKAAKEVSTISPQVEFEVAGDFGNKQFMLHLYEFVKDNRADIKRTVKVLPNGVETLTESDKPEVAKKIREHVAAMHERITSGKGIRLRDPLFAEIFENYDKVVMKVERTDKGVKVAETSDDPKVVKLIQAHAEVVSKFIQNGHDEMRKNHALPAEPPGLVFPVIKNHGGIVALPAAEEQPRKGAKVVFDVTGGADATAVNPGLERAARLLNLYGAAGLTAKDGKIVVVLHGDATKAALGEAGFAKHFKAEKNPNAALLRDLDQAGVTVLVCGQSLHAKGFSPDEVTRPVRVAASAMTAVTNRQADGYVYFPVR